MPKPVEECVESVLEDNPEYSESRAYAICNAKENNIEADDHDSLLAQYAESDTDCPQGEVNIGETCAPVEEVDVPPALLNSDPQGRLFALSSIESEPIERVEQGEKVVYKNLKILQSGTWRDSGSGEAVWYSPKGLSNLDILEDNTVNLMHDTDNDVSEVGRMVPDSTHVEEGSLYADIEIDTSTAAGEYADENLQTALESQGAKGFGGPSVEIPAEGQEIEPNSSKGVPELVAGKLSGLGLVASPASKPVSFARQTAERAVALSSQTVKGVYRHNQDMSQELTAKVLSEFDLADPQDVQDEAESIADELDVPVGDVMEVLDPLFDMDEEEEGEEMADEEDENEEEEEAEDNDEEEGDDVEIDMEDKVASLEERISNLEGMVEEAMMSEDREELSAEIEEAREELADAETVQELSDAKEELEKRLSKLEDEPKDTKTLADAKGNGEVDIDGPISQIESQRRY